MKTACAPIVLVVAVLAFAGCGSQEQKDAAASADVKTQVEQVCREVANEIKGLPAPTDKAAAVKAQTQSAQLFQTATGKLRELGANTQLPASYQEWIDAYGQLSGYNRQAAQAFSGSGVTSDQAAKAGEKWAAQAEKADALASKAGLDNCVLGPPQSG